MLLTGSFSFLNTSQDYLPSVGTAYGGLSPHTVNLNQLKAPPHLSAGQRDGGNVSAEIPSFQVTLRLSW